jgi:prevent-host-death family protein
MKIERISITNAKQSLGEVIKRVAYGNESFILEFRGKPRAALISYEDFQRLQGMEISRNEEAVLNELRGLRERIAVRVGTLPGSAEVLREIREERMDELTDMR